MSLFLAQELHDISPPVEYSLVPPWVVFVAAFAVLSLLGLIGVFIARRMHRQKPAQSPRARALELLRQAREQIAHETPYDFSIRVSDILRRYVTEQYQLPVTRQTSVEFLESLARHSSSFSEDEQSLLSDFLNRCDLIKFARYDATTADSELLAEEAIRFVQGGQLEPA